MSALTTRWLRALVTARALRHGVGQSQIDPAVMAGEQMLREGHSGCRALEAATARLLAGNGVAA